MSLYRAVLLWLCVSLSSPLRSPAGPLSCPRQDLNCSASLSNCMDRGWLDVNAYTPSSPEKLQASVDVRLDETGHLHPVLDAHWVIKDDGSIRYLKATELHVLVMSTNQNLCVRYSFKHKLPMRSPSGEKWSFSADMLVLDPGQSYRVAVFNIPKPEVDHSPYDVSTLVVVPGCQDPRMQKTQYCIERGSQWQPNISVAQATTVSGRPALAVSFSPDRLCDEYVVIVSCSAIRHEERIHKAAQMPLNVTFSRDKWPRSCCQFDVEIKPLFSQCGQDCRRQQTTLDICGAPVAPDVPPYTLVTLGVVFVCVVVVVVMYVLCRKPGKRSEDQKIEIPQQQQLKPPPKVLVIYSQDHHLYRDIVLKLCAFLRAKCGTKVLVDLLDSKSVSELGRIRWLVCQRQELENPSDKILVLCSRGVQAKWRAMCGQGQVMLREDILSPTDDMLTPFFNLFLPNMHQAGMLGKYMVAYFEDISSEQDVPSVFDIAVKYNLMKHFEELYFRILDVEKYQPGQVNHIEGIGVDEYFNCPSGRALRDAIETFQAYQLENPGWFEKECVVSEEEVMTEANLLIDQLHIPPVLACAPVIRDGPSVYIQEVKINEDGNSVQILTPELNPGHQLSSVAELLPVVNPECRYQYPSSLEEVLTDHLYRPTPCPDSVYVVEPVWNKPPRQNWLSYEEELVGQIPTEDDEEDPLLPMTQPSAHSVERGSAVQTSLDSNPPEYSCTNVQSEYFPSYEVSCSQPVEDEDLEPSGKGQSSGSDQGYISKSSSQHDPPFKEDPLVALMRLQEELFQQNLRNFDGCVEGN